MNQTPDPSMFRSIIAQDHAPDRSGKFAFIPTTQVIGILADHGWQLTKANEKACRVEEHRGFQEHLLRFRQEKDIIGVNALITHQNHMVRRQDPLAIFPEIVLKNAHDGTASFSIMAGLFRLICSNGLIVADSMFATHKIRHIGYQDQNVIDAVYDVVETTPKIIGKVEEYKQIELDKPEQLLLAEAALTAKYGQEPETLKKYDLEALIRPVRREDRIIQDYNAPRNTLWNTYNTIQEKMVEKGGRFQHRDTGWGNKKARGVKSVGENVRLNQALWALTDKMAKLKGAT